MVPTQVEWRVVTDQNTYSMLSLMYLSFLLFTILFGVTVLTKFLNVMGVSSRKTNGLLGAASELFRAGKPKDGLRLLESLAKSSPERGLQQAAIDAKGGFCPSLASILFDAQLSFSKTIGAFQIAVRRLETLIGIVILLSLIVSLADPFHAYGVLVGLRNPSLADLLPAVREALLLLYAGSWTILILYAIKQYLAIRLASRVLSWESVCALLKNH